MKKRIITNFTLFIVLNIFFVLGVQAQTSSNKYKDRFIELRNMILAPQSGYFSTDGVPYHSRETFIIEAPDYGHQSTSEVYSYWIWMEAMYGRITGDWSKVKNVWNKMDKQIIPSQADQPNTDKYKATAPAAYMSEHLLPQEYPSVSETTVPVGKDPIAAELLASYGNQNVYGMHWLLDADNWYGFGKHGDGVSKPCFMNTFQRGEQESVYETIPQPSWDNFSSGTAIGGYLPLFGKDSQPKKQWKYTNAPDADARVIQAMYWATEWMKTEGGDVNVLPLAETKKMGDYLRYAMFDKYFKPMNCQSKMAGGATGFNAMHYLMSWYYAWGGAISEPNAGWSWRIGCSHNHFGYQNPMAAYALSNITELIPNSTNAKQHWQTSLDRQMEFYTWLQSAEGGIAGGATNSWNGAYDAYPAGTPTFYGMGYQANPVFVDPNSNGWFGWQAWSVQRVAELYYITNDIRAKKIMDKWIAWVLPNIHLIGDNDFDIPSDLEWSGKPETWNPASPASNANLHVVIKSQGKDLGITASLVRTLLYYAAATKKYATLHTASRNMAKELLDRMWTKKDAYGIAIPEERGDYNRFFEQEVYVPAGYSGVMPNGDKIVPGIKFKDIRSKYLDDPAYPDVLAAYKSGTKYKVAYHRTWAQMEIAMANADFAFLFPLDGSNYLPSISVTSPAKNAYIDAANNNITFNVATSDQDGSVVQVDFYANGQKIGSTASVPYSFTWNNAPLGTYTVYAIATDNDGGKNQSTSLKINVGNTAPIASFTASSIIGRIPFNVDFDASGSTDKDGDSLVYTWNFGDGNTGNGKTISNTFLTTGEFVVSLTVNDGKGATSTISKKLTVKVTCDVKSIFGAPQNTALGTLGANYNFAYTIGDNGPDLSNVNKLGVNWNLERNSLTGFSFNYLKNTGHGYFESLTKYIESKSLNTTNPYIVFADTTAGMTNFKGKYYVVSGADNLVLVHENNSHALFFTNASTAPNYCVNTIEVNSVFSVNQNPNVLVFSDISNTLINVKSTSIINKIEIYNVQGQVLISRNLNANESQLPTSNLGKGLYIVKCTLENSHIVASKIIKR